MNVDTDNNPFIVVAIKEKLPKDVRMHLLEKELDMAAPWTPKDWRVNLAKYVRLREAVQADHEVVSSFARPPVRQQQNGASRFQHGNEFGRQRQNGFHSSNSFRPPPNNYQPNQKRSFPILNKFSQSYSGNGNEHNQPRANGKFDRFSCSLCERHGHKPSQCKTFSTPAKRLNRLIEQGRCLLCIQEGHTADVCLSSIRWLW